MFRRAITAKKRTTARMTEVQMYVCLMVTSAIGVKVSALRTFASEVREEAERLCCLASARALLKEGCSAAKAELITRRRSVCHKWLTRSEEEKRGQE